MGEFAALVFAGAMEFSEGTQKGFGFIWGYCLAGLTGDKGQCQKNNSGHTERKEYMDGTLGPDSLLSLKDSSEISSLCVIP